MSGILAATGLAFVAGVAEGTSVLKHCYQSSTNGTNTTATTEEERQHEHDHFRGHEEGDEYVEGQHHHHQQQQIPSLVIPSVVYGTLALPMTLVGASPNLNVVARMTNLTLPEHSQLQQHALNEPESWSAPTDTEAQVGTMDANNESLARVGNYQVHQESLEAASTDTADGQNGMNVAATSTAIRQTESQLQSPPSTVCAGYGFGHGNGHGPIETNKRRMMKLGLPGNGNVGSVSGSSSNNTNYRQQPLHPYHQRQTKSQMPQSQPQSPQNDKLLTNPAGGLDVQRKREDNRRALTAMRERKAQLDKEEQENQDRLLKQQQNQKQQNQEVINAMMEGRPIKKYVENKVEASAPTVPPPAAAGGIKASSTNKHLSTKYAIPPAGSSANGTLLDGRILPTKFAQNMRGLRIFLMGYSLAHGTIAFQIKRQNEEKKQQQEEHRCRAMGRDRVAIQSFIERCTECTPSSSNTGIALRLVNDGKQLQEIMRFTSLAMPMVEANDIVGNVNGNGHDNQEQKPREDHHRACTLPILCSDEQVHLPFEATKKTTKQEYGFQNMIWNQNSQKYESNMALIELKDIVKKIGEFIEEAGVKINIEDQIPDVIATTINEYTNRVREMIQNLGLNVPTSIPNHIQDILSFDFFNQLNQSTRSKVQDGLDEIDTDKIYPNISWWTLGGTEQDWNKLPVVKEFFFDNRAVGALGDGSSVLLESNLSTSLKDGAMAHSKRKKSRKYASSDGIGKDYCDKLCRAELNSRKIQHILQKKKKSQEIGEDLSLVHIFVGTNVEDVHDYDEGDEISKSDMLPSENVYINSMDAIISNIVRGIHENEVKIVSDTMKTNISNEADSSSIRPLLTAVDNVADGIASNLEKNRQSSNVVDRLGRSIRQVGSFAIYKSASAIDTIGSTIRHCGSLAASPVIYAGTRIHHLLSFRIRAPLRQTIHIYSDNIDIATWLQDKLKAHSFNVVWHSVGSSVSSLKSRKSIHRNDEDYVLFACSSDEATAYIASKEIAKTTSEAQKKRIIAIAEDTKSRDTLAAFLNEDKDSALIVCVKQIHEELFAYSRNSLSKNKMTNNIKYDVR